MTYFRDYLELFNGCVAYYPGQLTSDGKYADVVGMNHGTITGATSTGTDRFGNVNKAMVFDGSDDRIATTIVPSFAAGTILFWMKNNQSIDGSHYIGCQNGTPTCAFQRYSGCYLGFWVRDSSGNSTNLEYNISDPLTGNWQLVIGSWGSAVKLYVDSVLLKSITSSYYPNGITNAFRFGAMNDGQYAWNYQQGEAWIFNTQLNDVQIKTIYDLTKIKYLYGISPGVKS